MVILFKYTRIWCHFNWRQNGRPYHTHLLFNISIGWKSGIFFWLSLVLTTANSWIYLLFMVKSKPSHDCLCQEFNAEFNAEVHLPSIPFFDMLNTTLSLRDGNAFCTFFGGWIMKAHFPACWLGRLGWCSGWGHPSAMLMTHWSWLGTLLSAGEVL